MLLYIYIFIQRYICVSIYIYMYINIHIYMYINIHIYICICVCKFLMEKTDTRIHFMLPGVRTLNCKKKSVLFFAICGWGIEDNLQTTL